MNRGPAVAKSVAVRLTNNDGSDLRYEPLVMAEHLLPAPVLWGGQNIHLPLDEAHATALPSRAVVQWKDQRWRRQKAEFYLAERML